MTPYELTLAVEAYMHRVKSEAQAGIALAYYNAQWTIQWLGKKQHHPPALEKIIESMGAGEKKKNEPMTDEQMLQQVKMLNRLFGGDEVGAK